MDHNKLEYGKDFRRISIEANDLHIEANVILPLDCAPDNIRRYIEIRRNSIELNPINELTNFISCNQDDIPLYILEKIEDVVVYANTELLKKNLINFNSKNLPGDFYLFEEPISNILPNTLLTQILGRGSKLDLLYKEKPYYNDRSEDLSINTGAVAAYGEQKFQEARLKVEMKKYLTISLLDNTITVVALPDRHNYRQLESFEKLRVEDISILAPKILIRENGKSILEEKFDANYIIALTKIAKNNDLKLSFKVSRQNIALSLTSLMTKLSSLHNDGFIHCDVKPQNILCLKEGLLPFDSINVKKGDISPGMTINYCAPEQILVLPVSPSTDIYNCGLIILSIVDGILYGKTANYIIPKNSSNVNSINLLVEPEIYIDYDNANIQNTEGIPSWQSFLRKCLAFEQRNRFQNMDSLLNEFRQLLEMFPLRNEIEFYPNFGQLSLVQTSNSVEAAWFLKTQS